jgi:serine/threonine-protein kinase
MALDGAVLGGRFVLGGRIGSGGYGEVWRATDTVLSRPVAVKLLHERYAQRAETLARFQAEARHAGVLSHENIAQVYDYREPADGQPPYLVMELVDGPSLEAVLAGGPLDVRRTMDIIAQAAAGLQAAHAAGMIHRDVKPGNLLLAPGGTVKITDFGIAHTIGSAPVTASGEVIGTPGYLAPERVTGESATPASDLYSLGMVAYECLTGAPPFTGPAVVVALAQRERPLPPLPPAVSADAAAFVARLAAKDPAHRLGSAAEAAIWAGLIRDGVGAVPGRWPDAPPAQTAGTGRFRRRTVLAYGCVACIAVIVILLASVIGFAATPRPGRAPATSPPAAPAQNGGVAAPRPTSPATSPGRQPVMSPVAEQEPATPVARHERAGGSPGTSSAKPGHGAGSRGTVLGHGNEKGHGKSQGGGNDQVSGDGQGNGNDQGG